MVEELIDYDKGTGVPGRIRGEVLRDDEFELRVQTSTGRLFKIPPARVYRREVLNQSVVQGAQIVREEKSANFNQPQSRYGFVTGWTPKLPADTYATKLDIPSELTKVWDHDGSKWTRGDFTEFWQCNEIHYWEMDAYGPFTKNEPEQS